MVHEKTVGFLQFKDYRFKHSFQSTQWSNYFITLILKIYFHWMILWELSFSVERIPNELMIIRRTAKINQKLLAIIVNCRELWETLNIINVNANFHRSASKRTRICMCIVCYLSCIHGRWVIWIIFNPFATSK